MGVMTRLVRLIKADVHGVMDQMEDRGLLLNQYLRDMEEALAQKEEDLRHRKAVRERTRTEREDCAEAVAKLESDLDSAVEKGRDDIARFLIKKRGPLVRHRDALDKHFRELDR
ncbi:MAG: PspA/IM30 family protein [Thermodesulfobacteriota bacterium]